MQAMPSRRFEDASSRLPQPILFTAYDFDTQPYGMCIKAMQQQCARRGQLSRAYLSHHSLFTLVSFGLHQGYEPAIPCPAHGQLSSFPPPG